MQPSVKNRIHQFTGIILPAFGIIAFLSLFLKLGFYLSDQWIRSLLILDEIIAGAFVVTMIARFLLSENKWKYLKESPLAFMLLLLFVLSVILEEVIAIEEPHYLLQKSTSHNFIKLYFVIIQVSILVNGIIALVKKREKISLFSLSPAKILILTYLIVIVSGSLLLKLPKATITDITWIDALFTSTSAVCITGLSTVNISQVFSFEGQLFILILIQLGGLGIITLTSFIALFIYRGLRLRDQIIVQEVFDNENLSTMASVLKAIITITLLSELVGAFLLYLSWGKLPLPEFERIFSSVFHSVSAYCNAGFSIFPEGLQSLGFEFNTISLVIIMVLIVSGGLGFFTYSDIFHIGEIRLPGKRSLSLQTRIILLSTLGLILAGAFLVWIIQHHDWKSLSPGKQVLQAFFMSITSRTAGFSTVPVAGLATPALLVIILLMYIGGAPNSTSGGIKITTGVTLMATLKAFVKGKNRVEFNWNTIPARTVRRAFIVFFVSILLIFFTLLILSITEDHNFIDILFEIVSAFGTVGLSRGITPDLSLFGKIMIALVMFAGRIGIFTFAVAMSEERYDNSYNYPEINLMVG
jgi:potassium uptake TrkH family protein